VLERACTYEETKRGELGKGEGNEDGGRNEVMQESKGARMGLWKEREEHRG